MPRGVILEASMRSALSGASLIEQDDSVDGRIEELAVPRITTATRATVEDDNWVTRWVS
jgi:hypothetical protein